MRLIPLEVGRIDMHMGRITGANSTTKFPVLSWLIEHHDQLVLFDTGMHRELQSGIDRIGTGLLFGHDMAQMASLPAEGLT